MTIPVPAQPKIYHILHADRLASVLADGHLLCDARMVDRTSPGSMIGMTGIKQRRLTTPIQCRPGLHVGGCVPFYFCPRSIMLYLIHCANHPELTYRGGQGPILHLEADLHTAVKWAIGHRRRWSFTLSNAGSGYFEDRCDLSQLGEVDWNAVAARKWSGPGVSPSVKEGKQAEFLLEESFPWELVERIGARTREVAQWVSTALPRTAHRPRIEILPDWYY